MKRYNFARFLNDIPPFWIMGLITHSKKPTSFYINRSSEVELRREWDKVKHLHWSKQDVELVFNVKFCAVHWHPPTRMIRPDDFLYLGSNGVYYEIDPPNNQLWFYQLLPCQLSQSLSTSIKICSPTDFA